MGSGPRLGAALSPTPQAVTSAAGPTSGRSAGRRRGRSPARTRSMSASRPCRRRFRRCGSRRALRGAAEALRRARIAARRGVRGLAAERLGDPAGAVGVVERELAEHAGAEHRDVLPALARRRRDRVEVEERADVDALESLRRGDEQPRPVRRREDQRLGRRLALELARRVAEVEALDVLEPPLARELRRAFRLGERPRLVDLGAAEDPPVAGGERLATSSRWRGGRRRRSRPAPASARRE